MTPGSRRGSRLGGAPAGAAETSWASSSTIASRLQSLVALYTGRSKRGKPSEAEAQGVKKAGLVSRFGDRDPGRARRRERFGDIVRQADVREREKAPFGAGDFGQRRR